MNKENSKKKFLWIYAVVLFASAFTVLLLTAFSQLKLNNHMEEYKKKLSERENSIREFNLNLSSVAQEKKSLKQKVEQLELENNQLKSVTTGNNNIQLINQRLERSKQSFDFLLKAEGFFEKDNYNLCAQTLRNVVVEDLGAQARQKYLALKPKAYLHAMKDYYSKGREQMRQNNYLKAKEYFEQSLAYDETKYYEENSLYYLALLSSKLKQVDLLKHYSETIIKEYPNSEYIEKVKNLK